MAACKCRLNAWICIGGKSDIKPLVRLHVFNGFKLKWKLDTDIMLMLVQFCAQCVIKFDCDWSCQVIRSMHVSVFVCVHHDNDDSRQCHTGPCFNQLSLVIFPPS